MNTKSKNNYGSLLLRVLPILVLALSVSTPAGAYTAWTNSGRGDWSDPGNWSNGVPGPAEDNVNLTMGTAVMTNQIVTTLVVKDSVCLGVSGGLELHNSTLTAYGLHTFNGGSITLYAGSVLDTDILQVSEYGGGTFSLLESSTLHASDYFQQNQEGILTLDLTGWRGSTAALITADSTLLNGGTLNLLSLENLQQDDRLVLIDSNTFNVGHWQTLKVGGVEQTLSEIADGMWRFAYDGGLYELDYNYGGNDITLSALIVPRSAPSVPEPATYAALAGLAMLAWAIIRRSRGA
ncbi:PEP-CTERM sorting domain-containing protein [Opitutaceae bacterium TAV4]|uniref:PEP-CTERM sorting domain-containing protein n=1 Tax=Geminisphaera colitermitum TaxID=1148786 RepID=UPI000158CCCD|nr:PEP-CTERM sorting domain-containing protein [Geminisphaera colitermitum]RRJ96762.1 PEP-CTERM sorting domain-containing protein [Opitutaceae bacterium TAV4]RRK00867.1 PEP-CTERM sorting domain-containing protein [Opitutaceae bacterium TAV3]